MTRVVLGTLAALTLLCMLFPTAPVAHADGGAPNLAYVAGGSGGISIIDIQQQKVTGTLKIAGDPHSVYLSLDGRFLYVAQPTAGKVTMLAARGGQTICSANVSGQPSLLAFDPGINVLYAAGNAASSITELDSTTCAVKKTISTSGPVYGLSVAVVGSGASGGTGNQLWVSAGNALTVYGQNGQIAEIPVPGGPRYISIPSGTSVYVTTQQGSVYAVDLGARTLSAPLLTGGDFGPMDYDAFTGEVYVPDRKNGRVDVLAPVSSGGSVPHEPDHVISVGVPPQSIAITSDGQLGFIALSGGNVAMLDIPGKQVVNTIFVGGSPHFIITGLYPPLVGTTPQSANVWGTVINVAAYVLVVALFIVPILIFRRYAQGNKKTEN